MAAWCVVGLAHLHASRPPISRAPPLAPSSRCSALLRHGNEEQHRSSLDATMEAAPQARDGGTGTGGAASPPISPRADAQLLRASTAGRAGGKTTMMGAWIKTPKERKCADAQSRNTQAYAASP